MIVRGATESIYQNAGRELTLRDQSAGYLERFVSVTRPGVKIGTGVLKILVGGIGAIISWSLAGVVGQGKFDKILKWALAPLCVIFAALGVGDIITAGKKEQKKETDFPLPVIKLGDDLRNQCATSITDIERIFGNYFKTDIDVSDKVTNAPDPAIAPATDPPGRVTKVIIKDRIKDLVKNTRQAIDEASPKAGTLELRSVSPAVSGYSNKPDEKDTLLSLQDKLALAVGDAFVLDCVPVEISNALDTAGIAQSCRKYFPEREFNNVYDAVRHLINENCINAVTLAPDSNRAKTTFDNFDFDNLVPTADVVKLTAAVRRLEELKDLSNYLNVVNGAVTYVLNHRGSDNETEITRVRVLRAALIAALQKRDFRNLDELYTTLSTFKAGTLNPLIKALDEAKSNFDQKFGQNQHYQYDEVRPDDLHGEQIGFKTKPVELAPV